MPKQKENFTEEATLRHDRLLALFSSFSKVAACIVNRIPADAQIVVNAMSPSGEFGAANGLDLPDWFHDAGGAEVASVLQALDSAAPLVKAPEHAVWESLELMVNGWSGKGWLSVNNLLGEKELVTTWGVSEAFGYSFAAWCGSRSESPDLGTSWDAARRERRVVKDPISGTPMLVDPGANRIVDIADAIGLRTYVSCEGHPNGAYVGFHDLRRDATVTMLGIFSDLGWCVDPWSSAERTAVVRMAPVRTVAERDDAWRLLCSKLEAAFDLGTSNDRAVTIEQPDRIPVAFRGR